MRHFLLSPTADLKDKQQNAHGAALVHSHQMQAYALAT